MQNEPDTDQNQSKDWQTVGENLIRYVPSGTYYARIRSGGKLIRQSLKTDVRNVADLRLADLEKTLRQTSATVRDTVKGKMTFGDALTIFKARLDGDASLKPRSKEYRHARIAALLKSWPELEHMDVRKISKGNCLDWAAKYANGVHGTNFNNTVGSLKMVLDIAADAGAIYDNPARFIKRARVIVQEPTLPTQEQFEKLLTLVKHNSCADLIRFLAYGGFRLREAANIQWRDIDSERGQIIVRGDEKTGTKNGETRRVPIIPEMKALLERIAAESPDRKATDSVMRAKECRASIASACQKLGIPKFSHHDLRHLFVTKCLECNINPKVIAQWAGHKDGGVLILQRYGHVRTEYSAEMAKQVVFSKS
jgi:integrase